MYNWRIDLEKRYSILEYNNYHSIKNNLFEIQLSWGTGGEIFLLVVDWLRKLEHEEPEGYAIINVESNRIIEYGYTMGYLSK